ncbi:MAG: FN3 associated domain-containing protein [Candidatus Asgardarchaeia archaeon]
MPNINHSSTRVEPPTIVLNGAFIGTDGVIDPTSTTTINTQLVVEGSIAGSPTARRRDSLIFDGDVYVTLTPDSKFETTTYENRSTDDIIGKTEASSGGMNWNSETYYTVNGKDPVRTKANLYTGQVRIRRNLSGHDNTIFKARTYARGLASEVRTVEFMIHRGNLNRV